MAAARLNSARIWVAGLLCVLLIVGYVSHRVPAWLAAFYGATSLLAIAVYGFDKRASVRGAWRVRETTLHGIDLFGGIIGGLVAQEIFRHKTQKPDFVAVTWFIAALHIGCLAAAITGSLLLARLGGLIYLLRG